MRSCNGDVVVFSANARDLWESCLYLEFTLDDDPTWTC